MRVTSHQPVVFGARRGEKLEDYVALLKNAEPYAHNKGSFYSDSIRLDRSGALVVTRALNDTIGGGIPSFHFNADGSIDRDDPGPVVFPPLPSRITRLFPPGSVSKDLLDTVRAKVDAKRPKQ